MFIDIGIIITCIVGISEGFKTLGLNKRFIPLINSVMGMGLGYLFLNSSIKENLLFGLLCGLSASGLFDQTKILKK